MFFSVLLLEPPPQRFLDYCFLFYFTKYFYFLQLENLSFVSESQRQLEQLVLHVRALQLLNSAIQLAREEIKCCRLQPSNSVRQILKEMNSHYHQCLSLCKHLHERGVKLYPEVSPTNAAITADRLIYIHAIEIVRLLIFPKKRVEVLKLRRNCDIISKLYRPKKQCLLTNFEILTRRLY